MDIKAVYAAIRRGRISSEVVNRILQQDFPLTPEYALMAAAPLIQKDPQTARLLLTRVDTEVLAEGIKAGRVPPHLVTLATKIWKRSGPIRAAVMESPLAPTQALLNALPGLNEEQVNALARDEVRLILAPEIVERLVEDTRLDEDLKPQLEALQERIETDRELQLREEYLTENMEEEEAALLTEDSEEAEAEDKPEDETNIFTMLRNMTIAEKARLAMKANKAVRMLLIKDNNRMVARTVLRSPRLTENDVESIARVREVDEEILRAISDNKKWMRNYSVTKNLAFNPRTPLAISMSLTERLSNADIRSGARDHNIPHALRQFIGKVAQKRGLR